MAKCHFAAFMFIDGSTTLTTFVFNACFVRKLAPLADERKGVFHRISIATIDAIGHGFNVTNSFLALRSFKCNYTISSRVVSGTKKNAPLFPP
jgi:hypothetical protein